MDLSQLTDTAQSHEDEHTFKVNETFAEAFQTKKRVEELSKLQDKYGANYTLEDEEDEEEDLSDDDSDAELVTPQVDVAILRTLARIRQKDPLVYEADRSVFEEEESRTTGVASSSTVSKAKTTATKPILLKDYQRSRLIADPTDSLPDSSFVRTVPQTFVESALQLKQDTTRAFHSLGENPASDDDDEEDLLVPRSKTKDERQKEDEEYDKFIKANAGDRAVEDALEQEEQFLRDYILNRGWIDRSGKTSRIPSYNEITGSPPPSAAASGSNAAPTKVKKAKKPKVDAVVEEAEEEERDIGANDSEDDEYEDRADDFEHAYNFRFEEAEGPTLQTHSRTTTTLTARKPTAVVSARARAREASKNKAEEQRLERREEVRRLKALKRREVEDKLEKLLEAGGLARTKKEKKDDDDEDDDDDAPQEGDDWDLDGDWDPEKHDAMMGKVYGDEYGAVADVGFQPAAELEDADGKPTWDDDIDISDLVNEAADDDDEGAYDPSTAAAKPKKEKKTKRKRDEEGFPTELLEAAKQGGGEARKQLLEQMVEDYYKLDYEDKIGDLPTRFHYAKVAPSDYSLTPSEILLATDTELNAYVSLRKMAPYRSEDAAKKGKSKKRLKEFRDGLGGRQWGEEVVPEDEGAAQRKKVKWSEENGRQKVGEETVGAKGVAGAAKRVGKKERERRKTAAAAALAGEPTPMEE